MVNKNRAFCRSCGWLTEKSAKEGYQSLSLSCRISTLSSWKARNKSCESAGLFWNALRNSLGSISWSTAYPPWFSHSAYEHNHRWFSSLLAYHKSHCLEARTFDFRIMRSQEAKRTSPCFWCFLLNRHSVCPICCVTKSPTAWENSSGRSFWGQCLQPFMMYSRQSGITLLAATASLTGTALSWLPWMSRVGSSISPRRLNFHHVYIDIYPF